MFRSILIAMLTVSLSCSAIAAKHPTHKNSDRAALIKRAEAAAAYGMKDPSSAQFRNVFVSSLDPNYVCGEVNAKNSYGAYVGFALFSYDDSANKAQLLDTSQEALVIMFKMVCGLKNTDPLPGSAAP